MKYSQVVKPISYIKAHVSEVVRDITRKQNTIIITQHGEAKVIMQDIRVFEQTQESMAMLKILAQSKKSQLQGKVKPVTQSFADIRSRIEECKR